MNVNGWGGDDRFYVGNRNYAGNISGKLIVGGGSGSNNQVQFNDQDMWVCAGAQRGMTSRFARPGRLCWLEKVVWQLGRYVMRRVGVENVR